MSSRKKTRGNPPSSTAGEIPVDTTAESSVIESSATTAATVERPAWIDGPPVSADGQFIREGSPRPTTQMVLARRRPAQEEEGGNLPQAESQGEPQEAGEQDRNWGDPYKSIFSCPEVGFELGENRRFKQRVFRFAEKPTPEIMAALREHGFVYRPSEKAWTVTATPQSRKLTDALARTWAGPNYIQGVER